MDASCDTSFANGNSKIFNKIQHVLKCLEVHGNILKCLGMTFPIWWKSWRTKSEVTGQVGDLPEARFVVSPMVLLHIHQNIVEHPPLKTSIRHSCFFDNITPYRSEYSWKTTEDLKIFEDPPICWISFEEHHAIWTAWCVTAHLCSAHEPGEGLHRLYRLVPTENRRELFQKAAARFLRWFFDDSQGFSIVFHCCPLGSVIPDLFSLFFNILLPLFSIISHHFLLISTMFPRFFTVFLCLWIHWMERPEDLMSWLKNSRPKRAMAAWHIEKLSNMVIYRYLVRGFTHWRWWFSIVFWCFLYVYQAGSPIGCLSRQQTFGRAELWGHVPDPPQASYEDAMGARRQ